MLVGLVVLVVGCAVFGAKMWWAALVAYLVMVGIAGFVVFVYAFVSKNQSIKSNTGIAGTTGAASVVPAKNSKKRFGGMVKWAVVMIAVGGGIWYFNGRSVWQTSPQENVLWETTGTATMFGTREVIDLSRFKGKDVSVTWSSDTKMRCWGTTDRTPQREIVGMITHPTGESLLSIEFETVSMPTGTFTVKVSPNVTPR